MTNYRRDMDALAERVRQRVRERTAQEALQQRCAWCGALIREGALTPAGLESHGCCESCAAKHFGPDALNA